MTSFGRTKVKKTSKSIQVYRIRESPFSKGLQGYTRVSLSVKKIPDDEVIGQINAHFMRVCGLFNCMVRQEYDKITCLKGLK